MDDLKPSRRLQILDLQTVEKLVKRSNMAGISRALQQVVALFTLGLIAWQASGLLAWVAGFGYSILLVFCFCPLHESIHSSVFASRWLNKITGFGCGIILILPPRYFNAFHMAHHKYTQITGRDPELLSAKPTTPGQYLLHVSGLPYLAAQTSGLVQRALSKTESFVPQKRQQPIVNEARLFIAIYLGIVGWSMANQSLLFLWTWLLPLIIGQPFLRLFLLAEHTGCPLVADMFNNTRTTLSNPLMRWLLWNMNYHTEHHAYAGIPFFRLPAANKLLEKHLRHVSNGYLWINRKIISEL